MSSTWAGRVRSRQGNGSRNLLMHACGWAPRPTLAVQCPADSRVLGTAAAQLCLPCCRMQVKEIVEKGASSRVAAAEADEQLQVGACCNQGGAGLWLMFRVLCSQQAYWPMSGRSAPNRHMRLCSWAL